RNYVEAFMMHYNGYKYEEIAEILGIPLGTVKSRIFLARKKMMEKLSDYRF
ncbi:MAG: RNA polymerase sigma factor, partial [Bacteroidota bacterium]|nr:RNA polymerase sigma factor [Bacteroidota bacterium]